MEESKSQDLTNGVESRDKKELLLSNYFNFQD
jgi:hypothetical protein